MVNLYELLNQDRLPNDVELRINKATTLDWLIYKRKIRNEAKENIHDVILVSLIMRELILIDIKVGELTNTN